MLGTLAFNLLFKTSLLRTLIPYFFISNMDKVHWKYSLNTCCFILAERIAKLPEFRFTTTQGVRFTPRKAIFFSNG